MGQMGLAGKVGQERCLTYPCAAWCAVARATAAWSGDRSRNTCRAFLPYGFGCAAAAGGSRRKTWGIAGTGTAWCRRGEPPANGAASQTCAWKSETTRKQTPWIFWSMNPWWKTSKWWKEGNLFIFSQRLISMFSTQRVKGTLNVDFPFLPSCNPVIFFCASFEDTIAFKKNENFSKSVFESSCLNLSLWHYFSDFLKR